MTKQRSNRLVPIALLIAAGLVFTGNRGGLEFARAILAPIVNVSPGVDINTLSPAFRELHSSLGAVTSADRQTLSTFYRGLGRAVAADPLAEPVLQTTETVRRAHRAGLLFVWRGLAGNQPDKYPGLSNALSAVLSEALGAGDVPLNPTIRKATEECFNKVGALCANAQP